MPSDTNRRLNIFERRGWCPVRYAHHPKPIKDALRKLGLRPQIKQCFANSQRFFMGATWLDLEYYEGYITTIIPMPHGWLLWEEQLIDLTLDYGPDEIEYHGSTVYTRDEVRKNMVRTMQWCVMDDRVLHSHHPRSDEIEAMRAEGSR
ncbi:hypothetical protein LCGC14_0455910 [marine sediment metagenome]|uniref:Uncharacterized protein n=1 Tax=marine sediment metagenome TaxID=412755 RepID=A0A0F9SGL7_9ZZZZ